MARTQNSLPALRLLLAQRRLYSRAKRWAFLRTVGLTVIAVGAPIVTAIEAAASVGLGALAGTWIFLSRTVFLTLEQRYSSRASDVQEQFDVLTFGMPQLSVRTPHVTPEDISVLVGPDRAAADAAKAEALKNWYPVDRELSGRHTVAICQRANAAYAERLLNTNANIWLGLTIGWSVAAVVLSLVFELGLSTFILGVALPLLPALLDMYEQWRATKQAGTQRRAMANSIEKLLRGTDGVELTNEHLLVWQDQLYYLRRNAPQVPNLVYRRARDKNERAMNSAAAELAGVARSQILGGSNEDGSQE